MAGRNHTTSGSVISEYQDQIKIEQEITKKTMRVCGVHSDTLISVYQSMQEKLLTADFLYEEFYEKTKIHLSVGTASFSGGCCAV